MQDPSFTPVEPLRRGRSSLCVCSGSTVITLLIFLISLGCALQFSPIPRARRMSTQYLKIQEPVFAAASVSRPVELSSSSGLQQFSLRRRPWPAHSNFGGHMPKTRPFGMQGINLELATKVCMPLFASPRIDQDLIGPSDVSDVIGRRHVGLSCALLFPALAASLPAFAACDFDACVKECSRLVAAGNEAYCESQCSSCSKSKEEQSGSTEKSQVAPEKTADAKPRLSGRPPSWGDKAAKGSFNGNGGFLSGR